MAGLLQEDLVLKAAPELQDQPIKRINNIGSGLFNFLIGTDYSTLYLELQIFI